MAAFCTKVAVAGVDVLFPETGFTREDAAAYYRAVAKQILPQPANGYFKKVTNDDRHRLVVARTRPRQREASGRTRVERLGVPALAAPVVD